MVISQLVNVGGVSSQNPGEHYTDLSSIYTAPLTPSLVTRGIWSETPSGRFNGCFTTNTGPLTPPVTRISSGSISIQGPVVELTPGPGGARRFISTGIVTADIPPYSGLQHGSSGSGAVLDDQGGPPFDFYGNPSGYRWSGAIQTLVPQFVYFGWNPIGDYSPQFVFPDVFVAPSSLTYMGISSLLLRVGGATKTLSATPISGTANANFFYTPPASEGQYLSGPVEWNFSTSQGYTFGWVPFTMGPLAGFLVDGARFSSGQNRSFEVMDPFIIDTSPSIDIDGTIASKRLGVLNATGSAYIYVEDLAQDLGDGQWQFSSGDILARLASNGYTVSTSGFIPFTLRVTDDAGNVDTESATLRLGPGRSRFIVRPSNEVVKRYGYVLMQHEGRGRIWSGRISNGLLEKSDDEGGTYSTMSQAWSDVSGATPLDIDALGDGGFATIAKVGSNVVFRFSVDGVNWMALDASGNMISYSTVCPYVAGTWCVREHKASDVGTVTVSEMNTVTRRSTADGAQGSWQDVAT